MKTITEYIQKKHIQSNSNLNEIKHCFVSYDDVNDSNYEQYIRISARISGGECILKKDLYSFNVEDVINALQDIYKYKTSKHLYIWYPVRNTNCGFNAACMLNLKTGEIENMDDDTLDDIDDAREIQNYFNQNESN